MALVAIFDWVTAWVAMLLVRILVTAKAVPPDTARNRASDATTLAYVRRDRIFENKRDLRRAFGIRPRRRAPGPRFGVIS